jgi:hypothetical protein
MENRPSRGYVRVRVVSMRRRTLDLDCLRTPHLASCSTRAQHNALIRRRGAPASKGERAGHPAWSAPRPARSSAARRGSTRAHTRSVPQGLGSESPRGRSGASIGSVAREHHAKSAFATGGVANRDRPDRRGASKRRGARSQPATSSARSSNPALATSARGRGSRGGRGRRSPARSGPRPARDQ